MQQETCRQRGVDVFTLLPSVSLVNKWPVSFARRVLTSILGRAQYMHTIEN
jgi:hypothetical protein